MNSNNLISFAEDFVSYLIQKRGTNFFNKIILFGSAARKEASKESDIDLFIETTKKRPTKIIDRYQKEVNGTIERFYLSSKYTRYWKPLNIKNQINCIVGSLEDFPELKRGMPSSGIILYGPYQGRIKGKNYALFLVRFKGEFKDKMKSWRQLYGYSQKRNKKTYETKGFVEKSGGKRLGRGTFIIPIENVNETSSFLRKLGINYEIIELSSDML
ncbi:MAG: nucleotidyltransferase domain-containing protein [Nanoarchaeota archaeon]|nr:nucleotidyltransferase domain-containing protein [Nanoarchaeota archaeon]